MERAIDRSAHDWSRNRLRFNAKSCECEAPEPLCSGVQGLPARYDRTVMHSNPWGQRFHCFGKISMPYTVVTLFRISSDSKGQRYAVRFYYHDLLDDAPHGLLGVERVKQGTNALISG